MSTEVYRVAVSGNFSELSETTRAFLQRNASDHDPLQARFGTEPNLTYRSTIDVFCVRLEVRVAGDDPEPSALAELEAIAETEQFLSVLGLGHGPLRTRVSSMSAAAKAE